jgi:secretion/DNA translocation related TadE-like protein
VSAVREERGSASVLMIGIMAVVVLLSGAALLIAGYLLAHHRARAAADLAALSGATAYAAGTDACAQARRTARANGALLTRCDLAGDPVDFVVSVRTSVPVGVRIRGLPRSVAADAHAGRVTAP